MATRSIGPKAVAKAVLVGADLRKNYDLANDKEAQKVMFGQTARK